MKIKTAIFAVALTVLSSAVFAINDTEGDPVIKILPSDVASTLKLLYVNTTKGTVEVKLYSKNAIVMKDKIKDFKKGFIKRYDLSNLKSGTYQVEIIADGMSVKYELSINPEQPLWAKTWSRHLASEQVIASK